MRLNRMWLIIILSVLSLGSAATGLDTDAINLAKDYFSHKNIRHVCFLSCEPLKENVKLVKHLSSTDMLVSVKQGCDADNLETLLRHWRVAVGVLLDAQCAKLEDILDKGSRSGLFDSVHSWLVLNTSNYGDETENKGSFANYIHDKFQNVNLSVDADIVVAFYREECFELIDVFNFGKIQGNHIEQTYLGSWQRNMGLNISLQRFKYYNRWDFHNLTLRAVSVILDSPTVFVPSMLEDIRYTPGVSAMTKIVAQLLNTLRENHNFRFNYTIVGRWVGAPERNSTRSVTNLLFWGEQDISVTCLRIYPKWLEWVDPFLPPATQLQTKVYYLIPEKGVGDYENRFLTPLSGGVWLCSAVAALFCALVLFCAAYVERHPQPASYAVCTVFAAICQQAYDDGLHLLEETFHSQSRRLSMLVVGMMTMLLYNYYTSSVVSWLLSASPPTIANLDGLIRSSLELTFEDIGYSKQWLENPRFYYYSGFVNPKEDELREVKVTRAKRTVGLFQTVDDGIELIRRGPYAYHSEPYTASQAIGRRFHQRELCNLGALQMIPPSHVYIMGQKRSPYKEFFSWSLMRLFERGVTQASRSRVGGAVPPCSGQTPRALALGQAAPAFALLLETYCLAVIILLLEIMWRKYGSRRNKMPALGSQCTQEISGNEW